MNMAGIEPLNLFPFNARVSSLVSLAISGGNVPLSCAPSSLMPMIFVSCPNCFGRVPLTRVCPRDISKTLVIFTTSDEIVPLSGVAFIDNTSRLGSPMISFGREPLIAVLPRRRVSILASSSTASGKVPLSAVSYNSSVCKSSHSSMACEGSVPEIVVPKIVRRESRFISFRLTGIVPLSFVVSISRSKSRFSFLKDFGIVPEILVLSRSSS
mmetsp:Transcript_58959/g.97464  ORF Transcript_58959/g.97464 Transcript_58959/m.97464 type:complete len:212 (+) Transcript_58959:180-815(+)